MVLFGNGLILPNGKMEYDGETQTDKIMNPFCGAVLIVYMVIGLLANLRLIWHYRLNSHAWIDKFLVYICLARLVSLLTSCCLMAYQFLNANPLNQISTLTRWETVLNICSYLTLFGLMALDTVVVAIQYSNIHCPLWTILNGSNIVMKRVLMTISLIFLALTTVSILYGQLDRKHDILRERAVGAVLSLAAYFLVAFVNMGVYLTTWIRFWYQTGDVIVGEIIKREFRLVSFLAISDIVTAASSAVFVANLFMIKEGSNIRMNLYIWCFSSNIIPMTICMMVACYMLFSEERLRSNLFGKCWRRSETNMINN